MNRFFILLGALLFLLPTNQAQAQHQTHRFADYTNCDEYGVNPVDGKPERVYLEAQSWWQKNPENRDFDNNGNPTDDFGHIHVGTCFPLDRTISGEVPFKILVIMHNYAVRENGNPGTIMDFMRPHFFGRRPAGGNFNVDAVSDLIEYSNNTGTGSTRGASLRENINNNKRSAILRTKLGGSSEIQDLCAAEGQPSTDTSTCLLGYEVVLDTNFAPSNGVQEIRFLTSIFEPDDQEMHVSTSWRVNLDNPGKPVRNFAQLGESIEGRGWYTGVNYLGSRIYDHHPNDEVDSTWAPRIQTRKGDTLGGVINRTVVHLNPRFHRVTNGQPNPDLGTILYDELGELDDNIAIAPFLSGLDPAGNNRLLIRTESWCNNANASRLDDCDCEDLATANKNRPGVDGVNADGSCLHKHQVFSRDDPNDPNNPPAKISNDSQKVTAIMVVPFNYVGNVPNTPTVSIEATKTVVEPAAGFTAVELEVSSDITVSEEVVLTYKTKAGSATSPGDYGYVSNNSKPVSISPGETSNNIIVRIKQDGLNESDETFTVELQAVSGSGAVLGNSISTITIANPNPVTPTISLESVRSVTEPGSGQRSYDILVSSDVAVQEQVILTYRTQNGSAVSGSDFGYVSSNNPNKAVSIPANATSTVIPVRIKQDNQSEGAESFTVQLLGVSGAGATVANDTTVITIEAN